MLQIPELHDVDIAFGQVKHLPKWEDIPESFRRLDSTPYNKAVSTWFFSGCKKTPKGITVEGVGKFVAKPGVDSNKAIRAIQAVLGSFIPSHEHKEAGCAYFLSEWFDLVK